MVHFMLQICKMCPHTILKQGFAYLNFNLASFRDMIIQSPNFSL